MRDGSLRVRVAFKDETGIPNEGDADVHARDRLVIKSIGGAFQRHSAESFSVGKERSGKCDLG